MDMIMLRINIINIMQELDEWIYLGMQLDKNLDI